MTRYFGAAKDLPGVRDLLEVQRAVLFFFFSFGSSCAIICILSSSIILLPLSGPDLPKRNRYDMYRHVDADYYGYRDDEDGLLLELEAKQEKIGGFFFILNFLFFSDLFSDFQTFR